MLTKVLPLSEAGAEPSPLLPHTAEIIFGVVFLILLAIAFAKIVVPKFEKAYADRTQAIEGGMRGPSTPALTAMEVAKALS